MSDAPQTLIAMANDLISRLMESEGEITLDMELALKEISHKISRSRFVLEKYENDAEFLRKQAKTYEMEADKLDRVRERLQAYIVRNLHNLGMNEIEDDHVKVQLKTLLPKVIVSEDARLADGLMKSVVRITPDLIKIRETILSGNFIDGVRLEPVYKLKFAINKG